MGVTHHDRRWPALRLAAKRRDNWRCVQCGGRVRLEVDHIKPARTHPELAFTLDNLQTLDWRCHIEKTRLEVGQDEPDPARQAWRSLVLDLLTPSQKRTIINA